MPWDNCGEKKRSRGSITITWQLYKLYHPLSISTVQWLVWLLYRVIISDIFKSYKTRENVDY